MREGNAKIADHITNTGGGSGLFADWDKKWRLLDVFQRYGIYYQSVDVRKA